MKIFSQNKEKQTTYQVYIPKQYFPKNMWTDTIANDAMYLWTVKAPQQSRTIAAEKIWNEYGTKILSEINPWIKRVSLNVSGGTNMGSVEYAERLTPIQVHPTLKSI
jgi:hypothetical protein